MNFSTKITQDIEVIKKMHKRIFPCDNFGIQKKDLLGIVWWIIYINNRPVGFSGLIIDKKRKHGHVTWTGILKKYRGNGIHKKIITIREVYARRTGLKYITSYIHRDNIISANNLIKSGYMLFQYNNKKDKKYYKDYFCFIKDWR